MRWGGVGVVVLLATVLLVTCQGGPGYYGDKYAPSGATAFPDDVATGPEPEQQVEPHTCGLHSVRSIYRAYGLDPDAFDLRFRMGVDKPAFAVVPDTTGTLHPDMMRVLEQDGFEVTLVEPNDEDSLLALSTHLADQQLALVLTRVSGYHWVVMSQGEAGQMVICDSLAEEPYEVALEPYLQESVYSLLLIRPSGEGTGNAGGTHARGLREMGRIPGRGD